MLNNILSMDRTSFVEFVNGEQPIYANDNLKIELIKCSHHENRCFISVNHNGWKCSSLDCDSNPECGCGDVFDIYVDYKSTRKGIFLKFTSDDYSQQILLTVEVINRQTLSIIFDDDDNITTPNTLLHRIR